MLALRHRQALLLAVVLAGGALMGVIPPTEQVLAARCGETWVKAAAWLDANVPAGAFVFREWDMVRPAARHFDFNRRVLELWRLRLGKNWWRVGSGPRFEAGDQLTVLGARLVRPPAAARGASGRASADPYRPN